VNVRASASSRPTILLAAIAAIALSMLYVILPVAATPSTDGLHKVTICHRTNSVTNPYVQITVDVASVDGNSGNDNGKGDHLLEHTGPVWDANTVYPTPHNGDQWGDIIPPFYDDGVTLTGFPSLNWNAAGMAIFANGCKPAETESTQQSVAESVQESVAQSAEESVAQSAEESVAQSAEESVAQSAEESVAQSAEESVAQSAEESVAQSAEESVAQSAEESVAESEAQQSVAESEAQQSVAESEAQQSVAESEAQQSVAESEAQQSVAESEAESVAESEAESVAQSAGQSGEQSVEAGTGTPSQSQSDTAMGLGGSNPLPTIAFGLILLASLSGLAFVNVKAVRNRN
jgi:hypothetical protein